MTMFVPSGAARSSSGSVTKALSLARTPA